MAKITDMPIELLEYIFDDVATILSPEWYQNPPIPNHSLFPFNVASTCMLWFTVMKSKPKYWHQVVIDVADDPTPFLNTLTLFKVDEDIGRIVIVFSSSKDWSTKEQARNDEKFQEEAKAIENSRTCQVFDVLEASLDECSGITFDLLYQSSLPSSARICSRPLPLLKQLALNCVVYDCDEVDIRHRSHGELYTLDSVRNVALTGASFMELCGWNRKPHQTFPLKNQFLSQLSITHFVFDSVKQVSRFQAALGEAAMYNILSLSEIALTHRGVAKLDPAVDIPATQLIFDSVSSNFIEAFMPTVFSDQEVEILTFRKCDIPLNPFWEFYDNNLSDSLELLQLVDIPYKEDIDSLYNAIRILNPTHLQLRHCEGVTDDLLQDVVESDRIRTLQLHDCSGFSSRGVREFICARRELDLKNYVRLHALRVVEVYGTGPLLATDDAAFFLEEEIRASHEPSRKMKSDDELETVNDDNEVEQENEQAEENDGGDDEMDGGEDDEEHNEDDENWDLSEDSLTTRFEWNVVGHDDVPHGYVTDLRPANKVRPLALGMDFEGCPLTRASTSVMYTADTDAYPTW